VFILSFIKKVKANISRIYLIKEGPLKLKFKSTVIYGLQRETSNLILHEQLKKIHYHRHYLQEAMLEN
jgi:hypothetical protein